MRGKDLRAPLVRQNYAGVFFAHPAPVESAPVESALVESALVESALVDR